MNIEKLQNVLQEEKQPNFRLKQIQKAVFQDGISLFSDIYNLPKILREILEKEIKILSFEVVNVLKAKDGQSVKALLKTEDGNLIETVLISPKPNLWSACISCQIGCQMGCCFCATGKLGFKRNLTAEEITDQVLFWRQYLKRNNSGDVGNIVFMGMGEPFNNWEEVSVSIKKLADKNFFGFGSRSLSVSTVGISEGIEKIANDFPQVNLAISLHFADDKKRSKFMPVNKKDNLENLKNALRKYFQKTKRKVFLEYILLDKINDFEEDAHNLKNFISDIGNEHLLHVNLIRYNATSENFKPSSKNCSYKFKDFLLKNGINTTIRKSLGEEIQGACGQLAGK